MGFNFFVVAMACVTIMVCAFMWACVNIKKQEKDDKEKER